MRDELVFLTGATGFVGSHILRELLAAGYRVRALVRDPAVRIANCETVAGDLERAGELAEMLRDCRYLVHSAALYSFAPSDRQTMRRVNVAGTETLLAAAHVAGVERAVVTSSSATVGPARDGRAADESDWAHDNGTAGYHASKLAQERIAISSRVPVIALLPTAPVGPGDRKPTPTGAMILDFMRGRMVARPPASGGLNLVAVEDVARAHVAALRGGRPGERYLIGGENLSLDRIWEELAEITGRRAPRMRIPGALLYAFAYAAEARCRLDGNARPFVPLEGVRMASLRMYVDCSRAQRELGHRPSDVRTALERAVAWYRDNGN